MFRSILRERTRDRSRESPVLPRLRSIFHSGVTPPDRSSRLQDLHLLSPGEEGPQEVSDGAPRLVFQSPDPTSLKRGFQYRYLILGPDSGIHTSTTPLPSVLRLSRLVRNTRSLSRVVKYTYLCTVAVLAGITTPTINDNTRVSLDRHISSSVSDSWTLGNQNSDLSVPCVRTSSSASRSVEGFTSHRVRVRSRSRPLLDHLRRYSPFSDFSPYFLFRP